MHKIILNYLSSEYHLDNDSVLNVYDDKIYSDELTDDIREIFNIDLIITTAIVEIWLDEHCAKFSIIKFWEDDSSNRSWYTQCVFARTLGRDLVPVQPISCQQSAFLLYLGDNDSISAIYEE